MRKISFWLTMLAILTLYIGLTFFGASIMILKPSQDQTSELQARVEILRSLTEAVAIVIGAVWTYDIYVKNRYDNPYPKIQHRIEHYDLKNGLLFLSVFVTVTNDGKTKLDLGQGRIYIRQVVPIPELFENLLQETMEQSSHKEIRLGSANELFKDEGRRLGWDAIGIREWSKLDRKMKQLEPGQTREIQFEFLIEDNVQVIDAISYFEYTKSSWEWTTLYSLN